VSRGATTDGDRPTAPLAWLPILSAAALTLLLLLITAEQYATHPMGIQMRCGCHVRRPGRQDEQI
jgi:hypothetical protein